MGISKDDVKKAVKIANIILNDDKKPEPPKPEPPRPEPPKPHPHP